MESTTLVVQINKITTTIDGGWRITFDVSNDQQEQILELSKMRDKNLTMAVVKNPDQFSLE